MWQAQVELLHDRYKVVVPDLRGYGRSPRLTDSDPSKVTDLLEVLDRLGLGQVHLVGHSRGGRVAIDLALLRPDRVRTLMLVGSSVNGLCPSPEYAKISATVRRICRVSGRDAAARYWFATDLFRLARPNKSLMNELWRMMDSFDIRHWLREDVDDVQDAVARLDTIGVPTLVVVGEFDVQHFRLAANVLCRGISRAQLIIMPGVGHVCSMEDPVTFGHSIEQFLSANGSL
jgi:pimeloyl-ACP methyl ester carboxylesterase